VTGAARLGLFDAGDRSTIPSSRDAARCPGRFLRRGSRVFSFVGVLGITLVLFLVVAATARAVLGR
jgi:hypothetical protein